MAEQIHATFLPMLAGSFGRHEAVPSDMVGATITAVGTVEEDCLDGGMVIGYIPKGESRSKTVVFEFSELGMWVTRKNLVLDTCFPNLDEPQKSSP